MGVATLNRTVNRLNFSLNGLSAGGSGAALVKGLGPAAWFRYGQGITVTGQGVAVWADQSGNGRDLLQGTDGARPPLQADGSILFNGTDEYLKCSAFTLEQPATEYFLYQQVSSTNNDRVSDGEAANSASLAQGVANNLVLVPNSVATNSSQAIGAYAAVAIQFNSSASLIQVNFTTITTGDVGATTPGGFTLGARGDATLFSNIQVKEVIIYAAAHSAETRARVIRYLSKVGNLGI